MYRPYSHLNWLQDRETFPSDINIEVMFPPHQWLMFFNSGIIVPSNYLSQFYNTTNLPSVFHLASCWQHWPTVTAQAQLKSNASIGQFGSPGGKTDVSCFIRHTLFL